MTVFKEVWSNLESAAIATEEQFTNYVICRVLENCKSKLAVRDCADTDLDTMDATEEISATGAAEDTFAEPTDGNGTIRTEAVQ